MSTNGTATQARKAVVKHSTTGTVHAATVFASGTIYTRCNGRQQARRVREVAADTAITCNQCKG